MTVATAVAAEARTTTRRFAVAHRDGWCAVERGHLPVEGEWNTPTACGQFVVGPFGFERGLALVDCPACLAAAATSGQSA
jgi:hypothetical protein